MDISQITQTIISTINSLFGNLISSIDNNIYTVLDDIVFINNDILKNQNFETIFGINPSSGILLICNAFLFGFLLYYCVSLLLSHITLSPTYHPLQFVIKLIVIGIFMNCSFYLCEQLIFIFSTSSDAIRALGEDIFGNQISFSSLVDRLNTIIYIEQSNINIFSIDGIIKSMISAGFFTLIFSYSIRYILIKLFILLTPFSILCLSIPQTSNFFKSWIRTLISLLFIQVFVSIVLILIFSLSFDSNNLFSKFIFVGAILVLIKSNSYMKEFIGGLSTDIQYGLQTLQAFMKH